MAAGRLGLATDPGDPRGGCRGQNLDELCVQGLQLGRPGRPALQLGPEHRPEHRPSLRVEDRGGDHGSDPGQAPCRIFQAAALKKGPPLLANALQDGPAVVDVRGVGCRIRRDGLPILALPQQHQPVIEPDQIDHGPGDLLVELRRTCRGTLDADDRLEPARELR